MIPAGFIQDLLGRVDIVDVVGRHVELKRGGANFMGLCPFHAEKSPSFSVSPSKQFYYCFGCGASGDAIRFLVEHLGSSFVDAVEELAQGVGLQVPREQASLEEREQRQRLAERRLSITETLTKANEFYRGQLRSSPAAIAYLKRRGLSGEVAARFGLGWAPDDWQALQAVFKDYDAPVLADAGLVRVSDESDGKAGRRYDWFRNRVMFPIRAVGGEIIGFGGRVLDDSKPKYMNSPETAVFNKGRELYGLFEGRQAIRERGHVLVVEGYMDVVALAQMGFANAVATLGTACTPDHVQKLFRFTDSVVFSFDGDAAGRRAAGRALEAALPHISDLRRVGFLFLPAEHDPDSFVRERGPEAFEALVAAAVPLSRQLIEHASDGADLRTPEGRARLLAQAKPLWMQLPDTAYKRQLLAEVAREAELGVDELARSWQGGTRPAPAPASPPWQPRPPSVNQRRAPAGPADLALRLLLRNSQWWERLTPEDQHLLHELGGDHGQAVAWLEQQSTEHGALPWATLEEHLRGHELHEPMARWAAAATQDDQHDFADLQRVLWQLALEDCKRQVLLCTPGAEQGDKAALQRLGELHQRLRQLKQWLAGAA